MDERQQERAARNEAAFRSINERQVDAVEDFHGDAAGGRIGVICECSHQDCEENLDLAVEEYRHVRSNPRWFAARQGHQLPEVEVCVEDHGEWCVLEKTAPIGAEIAEETA